MTKFYFTDTIYLDNDKLYYESNNIIKEVKKHNWHKILNDFGWESLIEILCSNKVRKNRLS